MMAMAAGDTSFDRDLQTEVDGRLDAPAFHRNVEPVLAVLRRCLTGRSGDALEIGSGTGQHVVAFARALPALTWWPTDPHPAHRRSIDAWRADSGLANIRPAVSLDAVEGEPPARELSAIVSMNVIHIAPWRVCEGIMRIAGESLAPSGRMFLYGPFKRDGAHTAPSNAGFDAMLRRQDAEWGVRDLEAVAAAAAKRGLRIAEIVEMPANNQTLVFAPD
jgi:hypothetical protein